MAMEALMRVGHKLAEEVYKAAGAKQAQSGQPEAQTTGSPPPETPSPDEGEKIIDADYEVK